MTDRGFEPLSADFGDVEIVSGPLERPGRRSMPRPQYRLSARQLGIAFCLAVASGAAFAMWTKPVPAPPADMSPVTERPLPPAPPAPRPTLQVIRQKPGGQMATHDPAPPRPLVMTLSAPSPRSGDPPPLPLRRRVAAPSPIQPEGQPGRLAVSHMERAGPRFAPPAPTVQPQLLGPEDGPSFDCREAQSPSQRMVCTDPSLALADRLLAQSYDRAVESGVSRSMLRAEQEDWLAIRDDAARYSRKAVADVYAQRIRELRAIADERTE